MKNKSDLVLGIILEQAKLFLNELQCFAPFGTALDIHGAIKPLSAYIDEEDMDEIIDSMKLIAMLQNHITTQIDVNRFLIGAIAIDVKIHNEEESYDAIEVRFFERENQFKRHIRYQIREETVVAFEEVNI